MNRFYGESIITDTRNLILLIAFLICFFACQKEEPKQICKTCTITATFDPAESGASIQTYIESQTKYCNNETDTIKQGLIYYRKTSNDGGKTWTIESKERTCE